jgi:hypothetical protein
MLRVADEDADDDDDDDDVKSAAALATGDGNVSSSPSCMCEQRLRRNHKSGGEFRGRFVDGKLQGYVRFATRVYCL